MDEFSGEADVNISEGQHQQVLNEHLRNSMVPQSTQFENVG